MAPLPSRLIEVTGVRGDGAIGRLSYANGADTNDNDNGKVKDHED